MFKSIRWKLVVMFILMVVSIIIIVGTFFRISISDYYINEFKSTMTNAFYGEFYSQLNNAVSDNNTNALSSVIEAYSGRLGIDMFRNVYLLDGNNGKIIYRTDKNSFESIEKTSNVISALNGRDGSEISDQAAYMDFARPLIQNGNVKYIIYVKDTKEELSEIIGTILTIILQALLFGLFISFILGYFMSKTITSPIISLTRRAELMSAGNFETRIDVKSDDEIGQLTQTFNTMALTLKDTLATIEDEKNKIETILLFMTDGVMAFDSNGAVTHINHAAQKMLTLKESGSIEFDTYFKELGADISLSEIIFKTDETLERDLIVIDRHIQVFFASILSDGETVSAVIVVLRDITEQHKLELSRREFVSNVSHELRTPITTIKSYTETILETEDLPKETIFNFMKVVHSEADRMTRLVYDLLELSRLDYDSQNMKKDYFDLKLLLNDICDKLSFEVDAHSHKMILSFANNIGKFYGNRDRIEQVITNIIVNAVKYTPAGGEIKVSAGNLYDNIYIKVKDNGIGIPEEDVSHVFDRFYRVDKARSRQNGGGTGLGLAIAKEIVAAHNGTITIKSNVNVGTEITLKFPCKKDVTLS